MFRAPSYLAVGPGYLVYRRAAAPAVLLAAPLVLRAPSYLTVGLGYLVCRRAAARPRAVRAASFARRVVSKPGQALPPPTATAARPRMISGIATLPHGYSRPLRHPQHQRRSAC